MGFLRQKEPGLKPLGLREAALLTVILAASATIAGLALTLGIPDPPCTGTTGTTRTFTIVADVNGYNGSKLNGGAGPFMTASRCDTITINLVNRDNQSHGLSVAFYALNGVEAIGGTTESVTFRTVKTGVFQVYCNTQCSIHKSMQSAALTIA